MLHGGPGVPNSLTAYYRERHMNFCNVVFYDQRGCGKTQIKSKSKLGEITIEDMLEDLRQTVSYIKEKYKTDRLFLCGHSWGTILGSQYILKYPQDITGYIGFGQCVESQETAKLWLKQLKSRVLQSGNKRDVKKLNSISEEYPGGTYEDYIKATAILSNLELKYGYKTNDIRRILRKSPHMGLRDGIMLMQTDKLIANLVGDVERTFDIQDILEYQVPIFYVLGRHDAWTSSTVAAPFFLFKFNDLPQRYKTLLP